MAKKSLTIMAAFLCVLMATGAAGCGNGSSSDSASPSQVVTGFFENLSEGKFSEAYSLISSADQQEMSPEDLKNTLGEPSSDGSLDLKIISEKIDGETAVVTASLQGNTGDFNLIREDGEWRLNGIVKMLSLAALRARFSVCADNGKAISSAARAYKATNGSFPQTVEELVPIYLKEMPACPEGGVYTIPVVTSGLEVKCSYHGILDLHP